MSARNQPTSLRDAKARFDETRRTLATARIDCANRESEFQFALSAYLDLLSARISQLRIPETMA